MRAAVQGKKSAIELREYRQINTERTKTLSLAWSTINRNKRGSSTLLIIVTIGSVEVEAWTAFFCKFHVKLLA